MPPHNVHPDKAYLGPEQGGFLEEKMGPNSDSTSKGTPAHGDISKGSDSTTTDVEVGRVTTTGVQAEGDYPEGFHLFIIVLALIISVFLVALDMASTLQYAACYLEL
jgi:hypothetical protein